MQAHKKTAITDTFLKCRLLNPG